MAGAASVSCGRARSSWAEAADQGLRRVRQCLKVIFRTVKVSALITLATIEAPVMGEAGKVFSTGPEVAIGEDGKTYYIKGRNGPIAFSEVVGCRLAALAGLKAPKAEVGTFDGDLYAAIESVPAANRTIWPWLRKWERIDNRTHLFEVIAVDTWLVNDDRNMGNVIGSSVGEGRIEVFMIDFEKSRTLGENPFITSGNVDPARLWPTEELGAVLKQSRPQRCPGTILRTIQAFSVQQLQDAILPVAQELPFITWADSSIDLLGRRAQRIATLVEAVWATN